MATVDGSSFESASSVYGMPANSNLDAVLAAKAAAAAAVAAAIGTSSSVDESGDVGGSSVGKLAVQKRMPAKPQSPPSTRSSSASSSTSSDTYNNINVPSSGLGAVGAGVGGGILVKELPGRMKGSPSRTNVVTPIMVKHVAKFESVSDDEDKADIG